MRMVKNGLLEEGVHWTKGPEPKSHIYWCPDAITATLAKTAPCQFPPAKLMPELFEPQAPSTDQFLEITKKFREVFGEYEHLTTSEPVTEIIEPERCLGGESPARSNLGQQEHADSRR